MWTINKQRKLDKNRGYPKVHTILLETTKKPETLNSLQAVNQKQVQVHKSIKSHRDHDRPPSYSNSKIRLLFITIYQ